MFYQSSQFQEPYTFRRIKTLPGIVRHKPSMSLFTERTGIKNSLANPKIRRSLEGCIISSIDFDKKLPSLNWALNTIDQLSTLRTKSEIGNGPQPYTHPLEKIAIIWKGENLKKKDIVTKLNEYDRAHRPAKVAITNIPIELIEELSKTNLGLKILKDAAINMNSRKLHSLDNYQKIKQGISDRNFHMRRSAKMNYVYKFNKEQ